jgi:membrane protease YdiL (CAAX protease family)
LSDRKNDKLFLFFIITFAWTWIAGFIPLILGIDDEHFGGMIFKIMAGPAPSIVAIVLVLTTYTKAQKKDYFNRCFDAKQMCSKWTLLVMLFYVITTSITILVNRFLANGTMPEFSGMHIIAAQPYMIFLYLFFAIISGPLNEEFGWRGFALDKLFIRCGFWKGSAILGIIWAAWHLPWYFNPGNGQFIAWQASPIIHGIIGITLYQITFSCLISIIYLKTNRSIMMGAFVHMIGNFFTGSLLIYPFDDAYFVTLIWVRIVLEGLVCLYFATSSKFKGEIKEKLSLIKSV